MPGFGTRFERLESRHLLSADIAIYDMNQSGDPVIGEIVEFQGKVYYQDWSQATGYELFVYDPVTKENSVATDIYPGPEDGFSQRTPLYEFNDKLYFVANTPEDLGLQLHEYDPGTGARVVGAGSGLRFNASYEPHETPYFGFDGKLYFVADDLRFGMEVHAYDPVSDQISLVADIWPGPRHTRLPVHFAELNGKLYFPADDPTFGIELRELDPATGEVRLVENLRTGSGSALPGRITGLNVINESLYFGAFSGSGLELHKYDSALDDIVLVDDLFNGTASSNPGRPDGMFVANGKAYFFADRRLHGTELHVLDPETDVITMVANLNLRGDSAAVEFPYSTGNFAAIGDQLFFGAKDADFGYELRALNTTTGELQLISDLVTGPGDSDAGSFGNLYVVNDRLYFSAISPTTGNELYSYDPADGQVSLVADLNPGSASANPGKYGAFVEVGNSLVFTATTPDGMFLFEYDTASGELTETRKTSRSTNSSHPGEMGGFAAIGDELYFSATTEDQITELHVLNQSTGTVSLVREISQGEGTELAGIHGQLVAYNNSLYFAGKSDAGVEIHKYSPQTQEVTLVADIYSGSRSSNPGDRGGFFQVDNTLYFSADDRVNGIELRALNLDTDEVRLVADVYRFRDAFAGSSGYAWLQDRLYFSATNQAGRELWVYDPSTGETTMAADIAPAEASSDPGAFGGFHVLGDSLFFTARVDLGFELYRYQPLSGEVSLVEDLNPGSDSTNFSNFQTAGGKLYFYADDPEEGTELRVLDPVTGMIDIVGEFTTGAASSRVSDLVVLGDSLYFAASDRLAGFELHELDLDSGEIRLVGDIYEGNSDSSPLRLTVQAGAVFFSADDGVLGRELYRYDPVNDDLSLFANVFSGDSLPALSSDYFELNGRLYFRATSSALGTELAEITLRDGADLNVDGVVDCHDINSLTTAIASGMSDLFFDLTGDGQVDLLDRDAWLVAAGQANLSSGSAYLLGDANLDGSVDVGDFNRWNENKFSNNSNWCSGDFNADGVVDISDFNVWNETKFTSAARPVEGSGYVFNQNQLRQPSSDIDRANQDRIREVVFGDLT